MAEYLGSFGSRLVDNVRTYVNQDGRSWEAARDDNLASILVATGDDQIVLMVGYAGTWMTPPGGRIYAVPAADLTADQIKLLFGAVALKFDPETGALSEPPPPPRTIYKADIFRRATEAEAETITEILGQQSVRLQQIWANALYISTNDDFYPMIETAFGAAFGAARASQLLAS